MTSSKYHKILRSCKKSCTYSFYHAIEFGVFSQLLKSILPLAVFLSFTVLSAQVSAEDSAKKVLKITLPPIPEFKVPSPYPDNSHTVLEMKRRGGRFLNQSVQITGYIIWKYDCITELTKQGMTKRAAKKIIAKNTPLQGSAADIMKIAMVIVAKRLQEEHLDAAIVLTVHDELVLECATDVADETMTVVKDSMEHAIVLDVPLSVHSGKAQNWVDAH